MLVDPRPYTYEYRKGRYGNPTFQSRNLYESLYHRYPYKSNDYFSPQEREMYSSAQKLQKPEPSARQYRQLERNLSQVKDRRSQQRPYYRGNEQAAGNPEKQNQGYKLPSIHQNTERARVDTNLGKEMTHAPHTQSMLQRKQGFERFRVYERQQKPYNIISCYPKKNEDNHLRNFPKLTLEDGLIEKGSYHDFKNEKI